MVVENRQVIPITDKSIFVGIIVCKNLSENMPLIWRSCKSGFWSLKLCYELVYEKCALVSQLVVVSNHFKN